MKNFKLSLLAAIITSGIALLSCNTDPCEKVSCKNGGEATASLNNKSCACSCTPGFIGDSCQISVATASAGTYAAVETGTKSKNNAFNIGITRVSDTQIQASNVWDAFKNKVNIVLSSGSKITIAEQQPDGDKFYVSGSGTFTKNASGKFVFSVTYRVDDRTSATPVTDSLTATWTQQ